MGIEDDGMGIMEKITSLKDLPADKKIMSYIMEAMELNNVGIKLIANPKSR